MARPPVDKLPTEILQDIMSRLPWRQQLLAREVSRRWQAAADACLARHQELHFAPAGAPPDAQELGSALRCMPSLRRLSVAADDSGAELDLDVVAKHCRHLTEVSLLGFAADGPALERLCASCPRLDAVALPRDADDACVETLSRRLPGLRSLDMTNSRAEGDCLSALPAALERLTLADCGRLRPGTLRQLVRCRQLRQLDVSRTPVQSDELMTVVAACARLERLSLAHCRLHVDWLNQLGYHRQLRHLDLTRGPVHNGLLLQLPDVLPNLRTLVLRSCPGVSRCGLTGCLPRLRHLQSLDMLTTRNSANPAVLEVLHELPLTSLICGRYNDMVTGASVASLLLRCSTLRRFQLTPGNTKAIMEAVDLLVTQLPPERDVTFVMVQSDAHGLPPVPPGPLKVELI